MSIQSTTQKIPIADTRLDAATIKKLWVQWILSILVTRKKIYLLHPKRKAKKPVDWDSVNQITDGGLTVPEKHRPCTGIVPLFKVLQIQFIKT